MEDPESTSLKSIPYPRSAFFILGGYLTERFVYYGLFGGIVFYLQRVLGFSASGASSTKSIIESLIYFAPIIGAILSDTYLGKVRTVTIMCSVYVVGAVIFTLSSVSPIMTSVGLANTFGIGGLLVLGLSAGLMKAVYSSLGPDQFKMPEQRVKQQSFFYAFYWMINAGAFFGQLLTAQMRQSVQCFNDDCYFLPFALLCGIMVISLIIFVSGRSRYTEAPPDSTLVQVIKCIYTAIVAKFKSNTKPVDNWIDRASDKFDQKLIQDVKQTLRVIFLFQTFPLFWALFYQSSTGMIFLAKRLNDYIGDYRVPPELTSSINPLLILILIPIFEKVIYPICAKFNIFQSITTRMVVGMSFSVCSFIIYAFVSSKTEQKILGVQESRLQMYNLLQCDINVEVPTQSYTESIMIGGLSTVDFNIEGISTNIEVLFTCQNGAILENNSVIIEFKPEMQTNLIIDETLLVLEPTEHYIKDVDAESKVRVISFVKDIDTIKLKFNQFEQSFILINGISDFQTISPQMYDIVPALDKEILGQSFIRQDGVYDVIIMDTSMNNSTIPEKHGNILTFPVTSPSDLHVLSLIPQYFILTIGEILFSVSGMDFAYSQAPNSMKSVMQAVNLFTITIGLWIYAGLNAVNTQSGVFLHRPSTEAATFAISMAINTLFFVYLLRRFNRSVNTNEETESNEITKDKDLQLKEKSGVDNPAYE